jgi:hydantoinase/carbamoylase family amidase
VRASADGQKRTMKEELSRIGFLGSIPASHTARPIAAHFELHIEQGPILEAENRRIGVVIGGQAYRWFRVTVSGKDAHAGTTPFSYRRDAMLAAAKMITRANSIAKEHGGVTTTGILEMQPGAIGTMPHTVTFTLDIRNPDDAALDRMEQACRETFAHIAQHDSEQGVSLAWTELTNSHSVKFHPDCIAAVEASAEEVCAGISSSSATETGPADGKLYKRMISGAGHDSCYTNRIVPTTMIFTRTKDGLSHTPTEYCSPEDCELGTQVLLGAVLRYDQLRAERGDFA